MKMEILPSILSSNFGNLENEIRKIEELGLKSIHIDVMDGQFVPNITIGDGVIKSLRNSTNLFFDTHLMVNNPENHIANFADAGSNQITFHVEATLHLDRVITMTKALNVKVGVSLIPSSSLSSLEYILDQLDSVLIMSVNPGFGGQNFLYSQCKKIEELRNSIEKQNLSTQITVDGGVNETTILDVYNAGAHSVVVGSYLFYEENTPVEGIQERLNKLNNSINS